MHYIFLTEAAEHIKDSCSQPQSKIMELEVILKMRLSRKADDYIAKLFIVTKHLANKIYLQRRNFYMVSFKNSFKRMCLLWHTQTPLINSKSIENTASIPV